MTIAQELDAAVQRWPDTAVFIHQDARTTYRALREQAGRWAAALAARGLQPGARVGALLPNAPAFGAAYYAVLCCGAVFVPLDPNLKPDELGGILADLDPALLIATPELAGTLHEAAQRAGSDAPRVDTQMLDGAASAPYRPMSLDAHEPAVILYTSGTVGGPKGVALSHDALSYSCVGMAEVYGLGPADVYGLCVPMSHISGPLLLGIAVRTGLTLLLFERFHPQRFLEAADLHGMTMAHMVPPMLHALLQVHGEYGMRTMRYLCSFGMTASPEMLHQVHARWPHVALSSGYGLTETGPLVTLGPCTYPPEKFGACGQRLPYAGIRIVDDGRDVPQGESGEVWLSGPSLMQGYWRRPELTAQMMPDGWFRTGDIGMFDADGYLWIQGRIKDVINVAGLKVYAPEVEDAIYKHPAVAEVAVVGVSGGLKGEAVRAVVVPKPGASLAPQDIGEHCRSLLAPYKVPRQVIVRDTPLPRSRTGKIAKETLRADDAASA
jgi:long-chain acyl-CoA synthetase